MADDAAARVGGRARGEGGVTERILDSADAVLRQHGYAGFTTRRVAAAAGIAPGNLSYHYPTKLELLRAVIERLVTRYSARLHAFLEAAGPAPVEALVRWLLDDATAAESVWLFRELWAMALRDPVVRDAIDDLYDELMARIARDLEVAFPAADPGEIRDLVQFVALVSEGSTVLYGTRRERAAPHRRMVDLTVRLIAVVAPSLRPA
ncbi:MAG: TetR/AcrR family transcriptional regulator [Alphaproteobacteria bacterium]|nr:TetR/AcrR family transcriptional regulator [Alphaproteobacteria bacterium]